MRQSEERRLERSDSDTLPTCITYNRSLVASLLAESVLDQERKRMVDVELALDEDHRRKEEIKERKRYLDRAKNLQMVEDKLQDWWERSSRGMSRR